MIDKYGSEYTLSCDVCGDEAPQSFDDFYEVVEYKKENGWKSQKDEHGNWEDVCPDCAAKGRDLAWD